MSWYGFEKLPDVVKKAACLFLIRRYLEEYLEEKITKDQINVELFNRQFTLENIRLSAKCLNEKLAEKQNWPLEFVDGYIKKFHLSVPFRTIFSDSSIVEITGLKLTFQPKQRDESATSMFESMWNSMTSSLHLAEECAKFEIPTYTTKPIESIQNFAAVIESLLNRVKVHLIDTTVTIEYVPHDSQIGVGIVFKIDSILYKDESGNDPTNEEATNINKEDDKKAYFEQSYTARSVKFEGISISTIEFLSCSRTYVDDEKNIDEENIYEKETFDTIINESTIKNKDEEEQEEEEEKENIQKDRHVVLFGKFNESVDVVFRLKRTEDLNGPKVSIEVNFGSLILFLSPRQIHILLELINGLISPDVDDEKLKRTKLLGKPMCSEDYEKIEQDLQHQLNPFLNEALSTSSHFKGHGWSTASLDEKDDDNFLPMKNVKNTIMFDSAMSGLSSSIDSSLCSTSTSGSTTYTEQTSKTKKRFNRIETDPTAEISRFEIHIESLGIILLHEDLLETSLQTNTLIPSSVQQMQFVVENFFEKFDNFLFIDKDFSKISTIFDKACNLNHLRLMASPIHLEGDEKTTQSAFSINGSLEIAKLELIECLYQNKIEHINLFNFDNAISSLKLNFKHIAKCNKEGSSNQCYRPKTELNFQLNKCTLELDITIIDRISALLNPQPICINKNKNPWITSTTKNLVYNEKSDYKTDLKISTSSLTIKLRFPKPDFRPPHDMSKTPWWKRNVRSDYLSFILNGFHFYTLIQCLQLNTEYTIECKEIEAFYYENENSSPILVAKADMNEQSNNPLHGRFCRLNFKIFHSRKSSLESVQCSEPITASISGLLEDRKQHFGPFSAKKVIHESDTPHFKSKTDEQEELLLPGEKHEIDEFILSTNSFTKLKIDIFLPIVTMQLLSKHIYELIYNRINNDLLLWKANAPKPKLDISQYYENFSSLTDDNIFMLCKSGKRHHQYCDSDSESLDESEEDNYSNVFYSAYGTKIKQEKEILNDNDDSLLTLNLDIEKGLLCLFTPVREISNNVIPEQHGEFLIKVEDAKLFIVNGYKGNNDLGFICLQIYNAQLYHCDIIPQQILNPPLKSINTIPDKHLFETIYKSEPGLLIDCQSRGGNRELLTLAIKIEGNHETHHVKNITISVGFNKITLKHKMYNEPNNWLSQLLDFFNIKDYPIPGYQPKEILTELHIHFWDSSIDYRPKYLPLKCAITLGTFSISSHLSAQVNSSTLRFIAEECCFFISDKIISLKNQYNYVVDLKNDYVMVIDFGLFEISFKTTDKRNNCDAVPHLDLRASNNIIRIRTCADSAKALTQIIKYFANNGDLIPPTNVEEESSSSSSYSSSPRHKFEQELINIEPQQVTTLSNNQKKHISDLITEALEDVDDEEILNVQIGNQELYSYNGTKLFYFPDENQSQTKIKDDQPLPINQVLYDLGRNKCQKNNSDEEFCFIDQEADDIFPKSGQPEIKWLTEEPVRFVENHFYLPMEKTDPLKTPKNFPIPINKTTLCEMTVVWTMYGGNDFEKVTKEPKKKNVIFSDTKLKDSVNFKNNDKQQVKIKTEKKTHKYWKIKGGANRNHNVVMELQLNKIRFQHELYPENAGIASRQVLIVSEFEVRDRLETSQINKFLCQYTSQNRPKQSNANMLVVKMIHIRPDPKLKTQECCLKISLLPLRFNIDQDALLFLIGFFREIGGSGKDDEVTLGSKHSTPIHQAPIMTVNEENEEEIKEQAKKIVDENLLILLEENKTISGDDIEETLSTASNSSDDSPIYFRKVVFSPDVPIRLDYHGKRVDMSNGPLPGLLMGLAQLNYSELTLKRIWHRHGLLGFEKLITFLLQEWLGDIKKNQLPKLLGGVGPMHSFVQLYKGIRDLFWLPFEQYKKDGRFLRGLHRGANSFTTSTAMAALELTTRLIHLIQITAETAFDMLTPGPSVKINPKTKSRRKRYNQPKDIREGMTNAYKLVKEGIEETADNILQVASHEHEQKGYSGAVGGVIRQIPPTIIKPIIIATEATNNVLGGMKCQLIPDARKEANEKWRSDDLVDSNNM